MARIWVQMFVKSCSCFLFMKKEPTCFMHVIGNSFWKLFHDKWENTKGNLMLVENNSYSNRCPLHCLWSYSPVPRHQVCYEVNKEKIVNNLLRFSFQQLCEKLCWCHSSSYGWQHHSAPGWIANRIRQPTSTRVRRYSLFKSRSINFSGRIPHQGWTIAWMKSASITYPHILSQWE